MKYKSIEDCVDDIEDKVLIANISMASALTIYNAICSWTVYMTTIVAIFATVMGFIMYNWKQALVNLLITVVAGLILSCASQYARNKIKKQSIEIRGNIAEECFFNCAFYSNLDEWERKKIFNEKICPAAGVVDINYNNGGQSTH
jgi:hypothetical protein